MLVNDRIKLHIVFKAKIIDTPFFRKRSNIVTKMSFPDKQQRKLCWDARDRYWECLDDQSIKDSSLKPKVCAELRRIFENSCPPKWVTHFDRKRDYNIFKEKMQKEGFEPIKDN